MDRRTKYNLAAAGALLAFIAVGVYDGYTKVQEGRERAGDQAKAGKSRWLSSHDRATDGRPEQGRADRGDRAVVVPPAP